MPNTENTFKHLSDEAPIGVFDSGVGGLSILKQLVEDFPEESFVYLGDTARLPYGTKSKTTIKNYAQKNINYLIENHKIKTCVIACNSASTVVDELNSSVALFDVIRPGALAAASALERSEKNIGVWATQATVNSKAYEEEIHKLNRAITVEMISCPTLVTLVEEGFNKHPLLPEAFDYYLKLFKNDVDVLILGCTHFPIFKSKLNQHLKSKIKLVDSAFGVSLKLKDHLKEIHLKEMPLKEREKKHKSDNTYVKILLTDTTDKFEAFAKTVLTDEMTHFKNTTLSSIDL